MEGCDPSSSDRRVLLVGATNRPEARPRCHSTMGIARSMESMLVGLHVHTSGVMNQHWL
jgi:hypothetical protein